MDLARMKAIAVLGYNFNVHMMRHWFMRDRRDQAEVFKDYFREDRITALTRAEHDELIEFGGCTSCGLCPPRCRVMALAEGKFLGPLHLASSASRSQPDFIHDLDSLLLCAACGQCEPICPESVPVARMARAMRRIIWRVAPESLPPAYRAAGERLGRDGSVYGPAPALDLPASGGATLLLGPALRRNPEAAKRAFQVLQKCGIAASVTDEGEIGGLTADLGLSPNTAWIDKIKDRPGEVIVADPDLHSALVADGRLAGRIKFITEVLLDKLPPGLKLAEKVAVHDSRGLARGAGLWRRTRELLSRLSCEVVEMDERGPDSPPVGWEGGLSLVAPELASALASSRLEDAGEAGAKILVASGFEDAMIMEAQSSEGTKSVYLLDLILAAF